MDNWNSKKGLVMGMLALSVLTNVVVVLQLVERDDYMLWLMILAAVVVQLAAMTYVDYILAAVGRHMRKAADHKAHGKNNS